jgi:hypothetical protein
MSAIQTRAKYETFLEFPLHWQNELSENILKAEPHTSQLSLESQVACVHWISIGHQERERKVLIKLKKDTLWQELVNIHGANNL